MVSSVSAALADASTVHHVYTPEITLTGPDTATGVWAMEDWIRLTLDDIPIAFHGCGHYTEDYIRTDQGWRIKRTVQTRVRTDPIEVPDG